MALTLQIVGYLLIINAVTSLQPAKSRRSDIQLESQKPIRRVLEKLANIKSYFTDNGRKNMNKMRHAHSVLDAISTKVGYPNIKNVLREVVPTNIYNGVETNTEYQGLVENELKAADGKKLSSILQNPYVEQHGRNDFLVMTSDIKDPFVTVIPNNIYYGFEKTCVNWLEDCSIRGIRDRLLEKVKSPYLYNSKK